jgi:microcystin-dependent protein
LYCNGAAVGRVTYSALFALIGTTFGSGDGSSTFNLPNYVNKFPIGAGSTAAVGATGGSKDAVVVSHTHTATTSVGDPGHTHQYNKWISDNAIDGPDSTTRYSGDIHLEIQPTVAATTGITVSVTNSTVGESGTNKNLPPYLGINFIIKA